MIKKIGKNKYKVISEKTNRNMGTFKSREAAKRRLRQIEYFKYLKRK